MSLYLAWPASGFLPAASGTAMGMRVCAIEDGLRQSNRQSVCLLDTFAVHAASNRCKESSRAAASPAGPPLLTRRC